MTLLLTEGWETHSTTDVVVGPAKKWTNFSGEIRTDQAKTGTTSMRQYNLYKTVAPADEHAKFIAGAAIYPNYNNAIQLISFYSDNGTTLHTSVYRKVGGALELRVGGTIVATTSDTPTASGWHYIELVATLADAGGTINCYVDSNPTPVLSYTGDTKNGGTKTVFDHFYFNGTGYAWIDDIYLSNGAGPAPYNDRLGELRCYPLRPNGNGAVNQAIGSDGDSVNNYLLVDEASVSLNTGDWTQIMTDGDMDLYTLSDLSIVSGQIANVEVAQYAQKTDAGAKSIRQIIRTNSSNFAGNDQALVTNSYIPVRYNWKTNPDTGAPWTIAEINALQAGWEARP